MIADAGGASTSTTYAYTGARSLYFTLHGLFADDRTIKTEKLLLSPEGGSSPDTITASYYWYGAYPKDYNGRHIAKHYRKRIHFNP